MSSSSNSSDVFSDLPDVNRALQLDLVARGWEGSRVNRSYFIPSVDIVGQLPTDIYGTVFRNGPGLHEVYGHPLVHPIDGDGYIAAISFCGFGIVHFQSRFVETESHRKESEQQKFLYRGQMGSSPYSKWHDTKQFFKSFITGIPPSLNYRNPSNTNVLYWGGKLLSFYETHLPYSLDPRTLETLGEDKLNNIIQLGTMAAHFHIDPISQTLVAFSIRPSLKSKAHLHIYEWDSQWNIIRHQKLRIPGLNYSHDFALTKNYYLFHMTPFVKLTYSLITKIVIGWSSPGYQMKLYKDLPSRFVIIPRHKNTQIPLASSNDNSPGYLFSSAQSPFHIYHFGSSYESELDSDLIHFCAVTLGPQFDMTFENNVWLANANIAPGFMSSFTLNIKTGKCDRKIDDAASVEFPTIHPGKHSLKTRYNYAMASDRFDKNTKKVIGAPFRDIVKYDFNNEKDNKRNVWNSHGCVGEPIFIPRIKNISQIKNNKTYSNQNEEEDDGYVFVQVYIPETNLTEFCLIDAKTMKLQCRIKLKHSITFGFHGTFTPHVFVNDHAKNEIQTTFFQRISAKL